jgi:hypothetical protein
MGGPRHPHQGIKAIKWLTPSESWTAPRPPRPQAGASRRVGAALVASGGAGTLSEAISYLNMSHLAEHKKEALRKLEQEAA